MQCIIDNWREKLRENVIKMRMMIRVKEKYGKKTDDMKSRVESFENKKCLAELALSRQAYGRSQVS